MTTRKALIVGATGLVGKYCVEQLYTAPEYTEVIALTRKPLLTTNRKLKTVITQFADLQAELNTIAAHDVYCCLGTTIKKAGSKEAFRKIDYELVVTVAGIMKEQGAEQFLVVSALGADRNSRIFYNRVKGEMESALRQLGYNRLQIIRPSLLLGPRKEFRLAEKTAVLLTPLLKPLLAGPLRKYAPVEAEAVAKFMVQTALRQSAAGVHTYDSDMIVVNTT